MRRALNQARNDPHSPKARMLAAARRVFGQYGYHGATTRGIAQQAGVDISTLHYHFGDKEALYEAVVLDMAEDLRLLLRRVEQVISGLPLANRLDLAIDLALDYLFEHPDISNLILLRYFSKTRQAMKWDQRAPEFVGDIARSMGLTGPDGAATPEASMRVLAMMNSIHNFVSGEDFFRAQVGADRDEYLRLAKQTLKFMFIPAFTGKRPAEEATPPEGVD